MGRIRPVVGRIRPVVVCIALACVALPLVGAGPIRAASAHTGPHIALLARSGPHAIKPGGAVTFRLKVTGITLDPRVGTRAPRGHGHVQVYLDRIPRGAYRRAVLGPAWLASVAAPTFTLRFPLAILHGKRDRHVVLLALAGTNNVLYRVAPARFALTVR